MSGIEECLWQSRVSLELRLRSLELNREDGEWVDSVYRELLRIAKPWELRRVLPDYRRKRLDFHVGWSISEPLKCPACGLECRLIDELQRTWRNSNAPFLTFVRAWLPRFTCPHHGNSVLCPSWLTADARFTEHVDPVHSDTLQNSRISIRKLIQSKRSQDIYIAATRAFRPVADLVRRPRVNRAINAVADGSPAIELPFHEDPPYRAWQCMAAHPLGILAAVSDIRPLLASEYINVACNKTSLATTHAGFFIVPWRPIGHFASRGHCEITDIPETLAFKPANSHLIIKWLVEMISNKWYVFLQLNKYYIPNTWAYMKRDFLHDCLIVGCDGRNQVFKVAMYLESGSYGVADIPFTALAMGLTMRGSRHFLADSICFDPAAVAVRPRNTLRFRFDRIAACRHLRDYLLAMPSEAGILARDCFQYVGDRWMASGHQRESRLYGVEAILELVAHLKARVQEKLPIEMPDARALWEHKKVMGMNVEFWLEQPFMSGMVDDVTGRYKEIVGWAHRVHYLCFAYNQQPNETSGELLLHLEKLRRMLDLEREILSRLALRLASAQ